MSSMVVAEIGRFKVEWRKETNRYHVVESTGTVNGITHTIDRSKYGYARERSAVAYMNRIINS
jgi:hypothetical protein